MLSVGGIGGLQDSARTAFLNFVESSWLTINVVEQQGTVAGWAARERLDELISDFWIDPQFQRRGLGTLLLTEIEAEIVHQGLESARVETHAQNIEAVGFFEKHGYTVNWLSVAYAPKVDRDIQSVGLSKQLVKHQDDSYGPGL